MSSAMHVITTALSAPPGTTQERKLIPLHSNTRHSFCSCTSLKQDTQLILVGGTDKDRDASTPSFNPSSNTPFRVSAKSLSRLNAMLASNQCL